ncbi:RNA 2',3'-cyclic phosphodiesterase [Flammeovirgaceae bacterium SG7u.111]|nr:RNA 2',3'-cyclic phosphodiesterase [Flammeovirgaceae bacterium SG7u.132]WPO38034.1 RNA 2',3'-cyclic phosphodiesterase [Flammeovirgaceae bacterium SG7u.111]
MKKLFVGVAIEHDTENILSTFKLRHRQLNDVRWVPQENFHMTLCYIGHTTEEEEVKEKLEKIASQHKMFTLEYEGLEVVEKEGVTELVWARYGILSNFIELTNSLHEELLGEPPSREIVPHITLGRINAELNPSDFNLTYIANLPLFPVGRLTLWESEQIHGGVKYTPLAEFELDNDLR